MNRVKLLIATVVATLLMATSAIAADFVLNRPGTLRCTKVKNITTTGDSYWLESSGSNLVVSFEADVSGSATSLTVAVQHCMVSKSDSDPFNTDACVDYTWLDNAGASSNVLTGVSGARRGFQWAITGGTLRFTIGGSATGTAELRICSSF